MTGMDGARSGARRDAWRKISTSCPCGRQVSGNGKTHQRTCEVYLRELGWPIDDGMAQALRDEYRGRGAHVILAVQRGLGQVYLDRRAAGDKTELSWPEYRDLVWKLAAEADRASDA